VVIQITLNHGTVTVTVMVSHGLSHTHNTGYGFTLPGISNSNNFVVPAALAEVCPLLIATLVLTIP